jgi:hypothetical protein
VGLRPDFEIERYLPPTEQQQWVAKFYGREQALANHIKVHTDPNEEQKKDSSKSGIKNWTERARTILLADNQFIQAINLMNLFWLGKNSCSADLNSRSKAVDFINSIFVSSKNLTLVDIKNK